MYVTISWPYVLPGIWHGMAGMANGRHHLSSQSPEQSASQPVKGAAGRRHSLQQQEEEQEVVRRHFNMAARAES
eukprot:COSAG01_NODE_206_length_22034_cov_125.512585_18_plen_74_part_00